MFRRVSIDLMSPSGYCTPTKYWLPPTGSIQKFFLLNWMRRVERGDDVLHDVLLGQAQVGRLGAVDVDDVLGVVEPLDDPGVDHAVDPDAPWRGSARRSRGPVLWFLPVTRMLIGVDLPSFIAPRTRPPASKPKSRSRNRGSLATPVRTRWTYSCAERLRCSA